MSQDVLTLRQQALDALQRSTKMLERAFDLSKRGQRAEADILLNDARTQRTISTLLMAESNREQILATSYPAHRITEHYANSRKRPGR